MFDKIRQALGLAGGTETLEPASNITDTNTNQPNTDTEPAEPLTQDDLIKVYAEQLKNMTAQERQRYQEEIEALLKFEPDVQSGQSTRPQTPQNADAGVEQEPTLSDQPTVEELVNFITHKVTKAIEKKIQQAVPQTPPISPAYFLVDRMVKQHPSLATVADEALKLVEKLPVQFQTQETVDFIMWFLKGKRSEVEKKEALAGLFTSDTASSPTNVTLPYSNEDILAYANAMGIDPKRFKMRLLEEIQRSQTK
jgi:hypothetical protein